MANKFLTALTVVAATVLSAGTASATIFTADYDREVWNSYDDATETYTMKFRDDGSKDGFWLVVSPGPNPKTNVSEYAVLYGDRTTNRITAYTYDGQNNPNSYQNGQLLGTFDNAFTSGGTNMTMFSLDVSSINSAFSDPAWLGVAIDQQAGIWFHQTAGTDIAYNADGSISNFGFDSQMWLDRGFQDTVARSCSANNDARYFCSGTPSSPTTPGGSTPTTPGGSTPAPGGSVPAPGGLALLLVGLAGFGLRRKK